MHHLRSIPMHRISLLSHGRLLLIAVAVWCGFWILGWPDYYQQYSTVALAVCSSLLSVAISLAALVAMRTIRPERRLAAAVRISFYFTVPFAVLDFACCGLYLGLGISFVQSYWYLTIFYVVPWISFVPTAMLLARNAERSSS